MRSFFFSHSHNTYPWQSPGRILINYPRWYTSSLEASYLSILRQKNNRVTVSIREKCYCYYGVRKIKSLTTFTG